MDIIKNIINRFLHALAFFIPGGYSIRPWLHRLRGVRIGKNVWISLYVYIDQLHPEAITIGENSTIGLRTSIFTHFYWGPKRKNDFGKVLIGKNVYIGPHCLILPNVRIGEGAVVKGGSVVTRNVPPFTFWGAESSGPIARVTIPLTPDHSYAEFIHGLIPIRRRSNKK